LPTTYVLINADLGCEEELVAKLKSIEYVTEVHLVYGVYDIIVKVEADSMEKVKEVVAWRIRRLEKVRSTLTLLVVG